MCFKLRCRCWVRLTALISTAFLLVASTSDAKDKDKDKSGKNGGAPAASSGTGGGIPCTNAPVIICPSNMVVWTCSNSAPATYKAEATTDCCTNVNVTCSPPSGTQFPVGTHTVTCTARDTCGNPSSTCTFTVTVRPDTAAPVLHCPEGTNRYWVCTSQTPLQYTVTATDDCDTNVTIVCTPPPGTIVGAPGLYTVNCRATDDCGKTDDCQFRILIIRDTQPPVLTCSNQVVWTCDSFYALDYNVSATDDCDTNVTITCNPPRGTTVPAPSLVNVSCTARDDCGNTSGCQFQVRVIRDTQPPDIKCPDDFTVWGCSNRIPVFYELDVRDDCDTNVEVRCTLPDGTLVPSGTPLPPDTYVITCVARDDCGRTSECSFTVKVIQDTEPPRINCPTNIVRWTCSPTGGGMPVTYSVTATDDCDTNVTVNCMPPSGSVFPPGTNTVHCIATDDCGNRSTCSFTVAVIPDTGPPVLHCPTNLVIWTCTNTAVIDYTVTATDDCDTNVFIRCTPPPGTTVPAPSTVVVDCEAFDDCQKRDTCRFIIRVIRDTNAPVINCPTNHTVWTCTNFYELKYPVSATDDCDTNVTITCNPPEGTIVGAPTIVNVTCVATDDCGNMDRCQFQVRVIRDLERPTIICPTNRVVKTCWDCEPVEFRAEARDDCDTNVFVQCNPPSGTCFPVGTNEVTCVAIDDCGNRDSCKFQIVVMKMPPPRLTIRRAATFNGFTICWPAPSTGFRLQCARHLISPDAWQTVTNMPVLVGGTQWCVTLPNSGRHQFYRLCKPPRPTITGVHPVNPGPGDIVFIDGSGFGDNPDDLCVAIAARPPGSTAPSLFGGIGNPDAMLLYPLRAIFAGPDFMTARMPDALPPDVQPGRLMVGRGVGHVGRFRPAFDDIHVIDDVWTWEKGDSDGMGDQVVQPQPQPPPPRECWFFSGEPVDCQLCVFLEPNCPWPSNSIVSITARAHDSVTGAGGYDLDGPTIRFINSGGTVLDCAQRIADVIRCAFKQQAGVDVEVQVTSLPDGRVKITVRIPNGCIDRGFLQICVRPGNDPVITDVEPRTGKQGDMIMIRGANFGNDPDDICVVIAEGGGPNATADADGGGGIIAGARYIPLEAVEVGENHLLARLGPVPPDARPGRVMVQLGQGARAQFRPIFPDIQVLRPVWTWRKNGQGAGGSTVPFDPIPDPPPPPGNCWFYSEEPKEGRLCVFLTPDCPWPTNALVSVIARAHDATTGMGADMEARTVRLIGGGSLVECAERIKDILRCAFLQQSGVNVNVQCDLLTDGRVKLTVTMVGGTITHGMLTICVGAGPAP
jgi:hypothetical protein